MSRLPEPPNSRSPTWNVTVILSSLCSSSWKHSRECAFKTMLWDRTVGRRAAVATRAEATERRIMGRGTLCPRFEEVLGWLSEQIIRLSECCSKPKMFVAPELLAARECTDHLNSFSAISVALCTYVFSPPHIRESHTLFMRIISLSTDSSRRYSTILIDPLLLPGNLDDESPDIKKSHP